jgi:hypothetical protein
MLKPICVSCGRFFKPLKNGVRVLEQMPTVELPQSGKGHGNEWQPYKLWQADLSVCYGCGRMIVTGFGRNPISEHYMPEFKKLLLEYPPDVTVNDC